VEEKTVKFHSAQLCFEDSICYRSATDPSGRLSQFMTG